MATSLCEGQIAELIEHDEVEPGQVVGDARPLSGAVLGLEPVDEIDDVEEAAARSVTDERSGNRDGEMRLARSGAADEDGVALSAMKLPVARSRTSASLTGVSVKSKSSMSLASGSLATVSWYLMERACVSAISAESSGHDTPGAGV
ncbi:hypothetical protein MEA186_07454 [Mesorhizobium amorphae CCNWGS0123]|uniref:Uncharacterized protein n=1 Tax=Mesorhizobium amorphae CCNWGS0123 TaxID=1082933 RepID=G6Y6C6_9HYPH|nr:hypothetical protein MEA186_07454 [Mesorhizobium amorphae CCNWGS0123]